MTEIEQDTLAIEEMFLQMSPDRSTETGSRRILVDGVFDMAHRL